ncbi:caspase family protein [Gemmobacter sp.]|uniref:caspase family protein n=1 Tax=Gemmobacter sp. TaxID=1898957 RepID=UPI002AFE1B4F|nr:caspase family protein [Gemmobacter sp.]
MRLNRLAVILLSLLGCLAAPMARAEVRALLIGVSDYDAASGIPSLKGPRNDVRLMRQVLQGRGVADIRVLADGVDGSAGRPDRAGIIAAFAALADQAAAGDLVIITLSGHGTRQIDQDGDETDGLDEVFLPADASRAAPGTGQIPNALVDDELGQMVLAIRHKGADVVFVMDSCHSGSGLRAASPDVADRFVDPAVLGIRAVEAGGAPSANVGVASADDDAPGRVVAFYAARSSEVAREVNLTPQSGDDSGWYGLFTSRLAARLQSASPVSYRQLFQAVLADLNDTATPGAALQTPSWEGGLIDATVLGGQDTIGLRQFAVKRDELSAGLVHGFGPGTLFALVADATDPADALLGLVQIEAAEPTLSWLRPVAADCAPVAGALCDRAGALPDTARFARLIARPADMALRLAAPVNMGTGALLPDGDPLLAELHKAMETVNAAGQAQVVLDAASPAIAIGAQDGRLWFGRRVVIGQTPVGLSWSPRDGALAPLLIRMAEAERLAALLAAAAEGQSMLNPSPVTVGADLTLARVADLDPPGTAGNPARECRRALGQAGAPAPLELGAAPELKQCDMLNLSARGETPGLRDVNTIHIDSRFCLHVRHQRVEDARAALAIGPPMVICSDCPDGYAAGDERLFVVVTEGRSNADQLNLEGVLENCGAAPTRGAGQQAALDFLTRVGRRPDTRGSFGGMMLSDVWVQDYRWQVLPRSEVFARAGKTTAAGSP